MCNRTCGLVTLTVVVALVAVTIQKFDVFKTHDYHGPPFVHYNSTCYGAEDLTSDGGSRVIVSCDVRDWSQRLDKSKKPGEEAWLYAFDADSHEYTRLTINKFSEQDAIDIKPHGLYLHPPAFMGKSGEKRVFLVNHGGSSDRVSIFKVVDDSTLEFEEHVTSKYIHHINDVAAVSEHAFYTTNFLGTDWMLTEVALELSWGGITYCERINSKWGCKQPATGLQFPNGVAVGGDGVTLYVAMKGKMLLFEMLSGGDIALRQTLEIDSFLDNIELDSEGGVYVAGHANPYAFLRHLLDPSSHNAPSQVFKLNPEVGNGPLHSRKHTFEEILLNDGSELSAAAVGAPIPGGRIVIGGVRGNGVAVCG